MMDQHLVNATTAHCKQRLLEKQVTDINSLFVIKNFLTVEMLLKLKDYTFNLSAQWNKVELQEKKPRFSVNWDPDTVIEEVYMVFDNLTEDLNSLFGKNYRLTGIQYWKDLPGYQIPVHVDNGRIGYSIQLYLTSGIDNLGTHFYSGTTTVEIPYQENCGYLTDSAQMIQHGMIRPVPPGHVRYSLYGVWC